MESRHQRGSRVCFFLYIVLVVIMDSNSNVCLGAPVHSEDSRSNSSSSSRSTAHVLDLEDATQVINATDFEAAEQQGGEFADLQALRAGLGVLNTIAKNQLVARLQLSNENRTALDSANNATGLRLALSVTCNLKRSAESLWRVPGNGSAPSANITILRVASDSLVKTSCLWVDSIYRNQFSNSKMNFNNCSCELMTRICESLDLLTFTEQLEREYHTIQSSMVNQTLSNQWLDDSIERESVLPDVYDIIKRQ